MFLSSLRTAVGFVSLVSLTAESALFVSLLTVSHTGLLGLP
jgi:hypothetical protein